MFAKLTEKTTEKLFCSLFCLGADSIISLIFARFLVLFFINFQVGFEFKRTQTAFYVQSFIPSGLLVFASFLSLWIPSSHIPGRMTLTITTTLSLMTLMNRYHSIMFSDGSVNLPSRIIHAGK